MYLWFFSKYFPSGKRYVSGLVPRRHTENNTPLVMNKWSSGNHGTRRITNHRKCAIPRNANMWLLWPLKWSIKSGVAIVIHLFTSRKQRKTSANRSGMRHETRIGRRLHTTVIQAGNSRLFISYGLFSIPVQCT